MTNQTETAATVEETAATSPQLGPEPAPPATEPPPVDQTAAAPKKRGRPAGSGNKSKKKTAAKKPAGNKKGRPRGSVTKKKAEVVGTLTRCPHCDSTERVPYFGTRSMEYFGTDPSNGKKYNQITWRRTKCKACNRARIDKFYELVKSS